MRARIKLQTILTTLLVCGCGATPTHSSIPVEQTRWAVGSFDRPALATARGSAPSESPARPLRRRAVPERDTLGLGLRLELGAGQAPYDDAPPDNALLPEGRRGFSDSLLQVVIERPILPGLSLEGGLAAIRFQDEPLLEGLRQAQVAWVAIGIRWRF